MEEDTVAVILFVEGEAPSRVAEVNYMTLGSLLALGNEGYDTQVGTVARLMWV